MKYSIKCKHCSNVFLTETNEYGLKKIRCPYCGEIVPCQLNSPKFFRTKARTVIPLVESSAISVRELHLPVVNTKVLSSDIDGEGSPLNQKSFGSQQFSIDVSNPTEQPLSWLSNLGKSIKKFQATHKNGDLLLFFSLSFLFIILVICTLIIMSYLVSGLVESHSWLFKKYIEFRNIF